MTKNLSTPKAEVDINEILVRKLLVSQFPTLAKLPINLLESGWDNTMYRLGEKLVVRLPRRQKAVAYLKNEQKWLPTLADKLPLPTSTSWHIGQPGFGYPWTWSILPWFEGQAADLAYPAEHQAVPFAYFLKTLHLPTAVEHQEVLNNPHRGVPLALRAADVEERLARLATKTDCITPRIRVIWQAALAAQPSTKVCWLHGDLHARNVVTNQGKISAIIDWGDMTIGDPATDLAAIWMLFAEENARQMAIKTYNPSPDLLARAKGWAVFFAAILLETGLVDAPRHAEMGRVTFERLDNF